MERKYLIHYAEANNDGYSIYESYNYKQDIYQNFTLREVKEYVKGQRYKKHKPVCSCFLQIWYYSDFNNKIISLCKVYDDSMHIKNRCFILSNPNPKSPESYNDSTYLTDTFFNESNPIFVIPTKKRKCTCGQFDKLLLSSNFEEKIEELDKINKERERKNKEYYDRRLRDDQYEINLLQKKLEQSQKENQQQMKQQNLQHQKEMERIKQDNDRRETEFNEERRANEQKFQNMENTRNQERSEYLQTIRKMENQREIERNENKEKFEYIETERNKERKLYTKRFNTLENELKEKDEQLRKNTQKLEDNENLKKLLEKSQKDAENEFLTNNGEIYDNYFHNNKKQIIEEISKKTKELIDQKIYFEIIDEDLISKIVRAEKFLKIVKEFMEDKISNIKEENNNINISSINIIIVGNTGVGKSTLLNTILKEKLAKTDLCDPCTMGVPKPYESEKAKGIRIWDSRGIENGKYNLETAFSDIQNTIDSQIKNNDPDKFIHCIWYCICSNRFSDEEVNNLKKCYDSYIEKLPIIVVFTQSHNLIQTNQMIEKIKNKLEKANDLNGFDEKGVNDIKIVKVLAEDFIHTLGTVKSFGIHNLMEQTFESGKIGIERACTHSLMEEGKEMLKEEFGEIIKKSKEKIFENKKEIIIDENNNNNEIPKDNLLNNILNEEKKKKNDFNINNIPNFNFLNFKNFCKIFSREILKKLLLKEDLSDETISDIDKIIDAESSKIKDFLECIFLSQFDTIANNLSEELIDFVSKLETKYQISSLSSKYNYNELKRQAKNVINKKFKPEIDDYIYREMSLILFVKLAEKIENELLLCFHELLKGNRLRQIFTTKGKENSLVFLKKIKNLMDYPSDEYEERNPKKKEKESKYANLNDDEE